MQVPAIPYDEEARLESLLACSILDTPPDTRFDRLTSLAQRIFRCRMASVTMVDRDRQWFKSRQGLDVIETPRSISFCGHTILSEAILYIPDTLADPRFVDNPLVTGPPFIRFYAGAPLHGGDGQRIGTLCVIDDQPRALAEEDLVGLRDLADGVEVEILRNLQEQQHDALLALTSISSLSTTEPLALLRRGLSLAAGYLGTPHALILADSGDHLDIVAQIGPDDSLAEITTLPRGPLFDELVRNEDTPLVVPMLAVSDYRSGALYQTLGMQSTVAVPLALKDGDVAALCFAAREPGRLKTSAELEFARLFGHWTTSVIERLRLDRSLQRYEMMRDVIADARARFIGSNASGGAFDLLLDALLELTASRFGWVGEVRHSRAGLPFVRPIALATHPGKDHRSFPEIDVPVSAPILGGVFDSGGAVLLRDLQAHWSGAPFAALLPPPPALMVVPLLAGGRLVGVVCLAGQAAGYSTDSGAGIEKDLVPLLDSLGELIVAARQDRQLRESEGRLRAVIDGTRIGTWEWSLPNGDATFNARWAEIIGYELDELGLTTVQNWHDLLHPDDRTPVRTALDQHFCRASDRVDLPCRLRHKNGRWVWTQFCGQVLAWGQGGQPLTMAGTQVDISERKQMERMQREFVSTVSHELRTPLTAISGALGLMTGGALGPLPLPLAPMITIAHKNSQRLTLLINDLLDMEKLAAGQMHFDLQDQPLLPLLEQSLEGNRGYGAGRGVELVWRSPPPQVWVRVDSQRMQQVMSNLLSNAIKYSPDHGSVAIEVTCVDDEVRVSVHDKGPGISAAFRNRIFEKFAQADSSDSRQKGGTGLGLAITREMMSHMAGRISFDSVEGQGASFHVDLPIRPQAVLPGG
jgi:PAS domain S-box-containing protein